MSKKKSAEVRTVIHVTAIRFTEGKKKEKFEVISRSKKGNTYNSQLNHGNQIWSSKKIYLKTKLDPTANDEQIRKAISKEFKEFQSKKSYRDFTATVQNFTGRITNGYRARIKGDKSSGARMISINKEQIAKKVREKNKLRKARGLKPVPLKKAVEAVFENRRSKLLGSVHAIEMKTYKGFKKSKSQKAKLARIKKQKTTTKRSKK